MTCNAAAHLKASLTRPFRYFENIQKVVCQDAKVKAADSFFCIFQIYRAGYETWLGLAGGANHVRKYGENDTTVCCSDRTHGRIVFVFRGVYALP